MESSNNDNGGGFHRPPSAFTADRGGMAEDADLLAEARGYLAELRAISMKSTSSRFAEDGGENNDTDDNGMMNNTNADNDGVMIPGDGRAGLAVESDGNTVNEEVMGDNANVNNVADDAGYDAAASMVATEVEAESSPSTSPNGSMTYADVNKLAYRALQKECKALGLLAVGTTAALRKNLLEHFGLARESAAVEVPSATAAEIEVRTIYYGHCNNPIVFCEGCIFFCAHLLYGCSISHSIMIIPHPLCNNTNHRSSVPPKALPSATKAIPTLISNPSLMR